MSPCHRQRGLREIAGWAPPTGAPASVLAEEGRADAALHPGGEHHHPLVRALGPGGGHRVHRARASHLHPGPESGQRASALQDPTRGGEGGGQEQRQAPRTAGGVVRHGAVGGLRKAPAPLPPPTPDPCCLRKQYLGERRSP